MSSFHCFVNERTVSEFFAVSVEALRADFSLLIHGIHWLVALVPWNLHLIVFNDVLLDDGVTGAQGRRLLHCARVEVSLRNKSIVAWNMRSGLRSTNCQLMVLVLLHFRLPRQLGPRVVPVGAEGHLELSVEVAALARVRLTVVAPQWSLTDSYR